MTSKIPGKKRPENERRPTGRAVEYNTHSSCQMVEVIGRRRSTAYLFDKLRKDIGANFPVRNIRTLADTPVTCGRLHRHSVFRPQNNLAYRLDKSPEGHTNRRTIVKKGLQPKQDTTYRINLAGTVLTSKRTNGWTSFNGWTVLDVFKTTS
jgi:hypothetical protein